MKRDGKATRERAIEQTAALLNRQGYLATPVSRILQATGLQKGGLYNHFDSRQALALEAFRFAVARSASRMLAAVQDQPDARSRLLALFAVFRNFPLDEAFGGGCPIVNLAVESDDADPQLRAAARRAMTRLLGLFEKVIAEGIEAGEFEPGSPRDRASFLVAAVEGGVILSNLYRDTGHLHAVLGHLEREVRRGFRAWSE